MRSNLEAPARRRVAAALLTVLVSVMIQPAVHAQPFPNQPLRVSVGAPAGSIDDIHARKITITTP